MLICHIGIPKGISKTSSVGIHVYLNIQPRTSHQLQDITIESTARHTDLPTNFQQTSQASTIKNQQPRHRGCSRRGRGPPGLTISASRRHHHSAVAPWPQRTHRRIDAPQDEVHRPLPAFGSGRLASAADKSPGFQRSVRGRNGRTTASELQFRRNKMATATVHPPVDAFVAEDGCPAIQTGPRPDMGTGDDRPEDASYPY